MHHLFKLEDENSIQNVHDEIVAHQKNLQSFIAETPSYQDVTNEVRGEVEQIKKEIQAAAEEEIEKIRKESFEHVSDEEIIRRYEAIKRDLEDRLIKTLNDKQDQEDARKVLKEEMDRVEAELAEIKKKWADEKSEKEKLYTDNQELMSLVNRLKKQIGEVDDSQEILYKSYETDPVVKQLYRKR